MQSKSSSKRW